MKNKVAARAKEIMKVAHVLRQGCVQKAQGELGLGGGVASVDKSPTSGGGDRKRIMRSKAPPQL